MNSIPIGKFRRLSRLSNTNGQFSMLAIDQRKSLRQMISGTTGQSPDSVPAEALQLVKRIVTRELADGASALLTDPLFGYPTTYDVVPRTTGVMLSIEVTGFNIVNNYERHSRLIPGFSVEKAAQLGADAIKLLIWHNKEASAETIEHQNSIIKRVAEDCNRYEVPLILEIVNYPSGNIDVTSAAYAREKAERVIEAAHTFSQPEFGVDVLKLEFPGNLKYTDAFQDRSFAAGETVYTLDDVHNFNKQVNEASLVPWVILSAGVDPEEFIENIHISNKAGASGFLCGRAVWKHIVDFYPDETAMTNYIKNKAKHYFDEILQANTQALPWLDHKRFK
ncbi:MAG: tagatose 1,6-diphosphate aldolase [Balneolales bacterium]|nr:tagatose 1,6-diphosphate aldolase [Balneolales bacterium]